MAIPHRESFTTTQQLGDPHVMSSYLYKQIQQQFFDKITTNEWAPGMLLPSETELAKTYQVSLGTVKKL